MDFQVGGQKYRSGKMDAFTQFHVMRKLTPVLAKLGSIPEALAAALPAEGAASDDIEIDTGAGLKAILPLAEAIAALPEDEVNDILGKCLSVVSRESGAGYAPIWSAAAKRMMFDDIGMIEMVQLAVSVVQESLSNFTGDLSSTFTVAATGPKSRR